jgi:hypothetical protein
MTKTPVKSNRLFFYGTLFILSLLFSMALADEEYRLKWLVDDATPYFAYLKPYVTELTTIGVALVIVLFVYNKLSQELFVVFQPDTKDKIPNGKLLARAARSRASGKIPPAYPTGWFKVGYSRSLKVGEVQ